MIQPNSSLYCDDNLLVILDSGVSGYADLAEKISPAAKVVLLDPKQDAIAQITVALHSFARPFASLHIVVKCSPGVLHFSSGDFSLKTLSAYVDPIQQWFALDESERTGRTPEVVVYGRRVTRGKKGQQFADTLAWLTGATIASASIYLDNQPQTATNIKGRLLPFSLAV